MSLRVVLSERAKQDIKSAYDWWARRRSAEQAERWFDGILDAMDSLASDADRQPDADEAAHLPVPMKVLPFGLGRRPTHRVLFTIRPECVYIVRVWHVSQDAIGADDL
jgi:plasmid stabilization system protein ParE